MTLAVSAANSTQPATSQTVPIVILGTDAVLAASPAAPVQLAHACLRAGFANVVPASWGDELVAAAVLSRLPHFGSGPVIQCSCPIVAHRLLTVGGDLRPVLLPLVAPPVAVARYVRALALPTRTRITFVGACPGAVDDSIDIRMTPDALIAMLAEREIVLEDQPHVFESILPPDRRRYRSQPGGVPSAEALWTELGSRTLAEVEGEDFITEIAQLLLTGKNVLIDAGPRLGCVCSGSGTSVRHPRAAIVALEPPRSTTPVVDETAPIDLDLPVPAVSRTPIDVVAVPTTSLPHSTPPGGNETQFGNRFSPVRASGPLTEPRQPRGGNPIAPRPVMSAFPVARDLEGRALPRAYVARRRSPKGTSLSLPPEDATRDVDLPSAGPSERPTSEKSQPTQPISPRVVAPETTGIEARPPVLPTQSLTPEPVTPPVGMIQEPAASSSVAAGPTPALSPSAAYMAEISSSPTLRPPYNGPNPEPSDVMARDRPTPPRAHASSDPLPQRRMAPDAMRRSGAPVWTLSRGRLVVILIAIMMITISVSTVVAIIVGRSVNASVNSPLSR
jgi:hypothetical protein